MIFDYSVIWDSLPLYFSGVLMTLKLLAISLAIGLAMAVPLALMRVSKQAVINFPAWLYTYVIRGTPMLVQLYLLYYGLAQFEAVRDSMLWPMLSNATFCACLAACSGRGRKITSASPSPMWRRKSCRRSPIGWSRARQA